MKLRRLFAAMSAAAVAVASISAVASAAIADTETVFDDSWSKNIQVAAGTITEACKIEINVKDVKADGQITIKEMSGWTAIDLTDKFTTDGSSASFDTQWGVLCISEDTTKVTVELSADDAATLKAAGVVFAGKNYTFVSADFAAEDEVVIDAPAADTAAGASATCAYIDGKTASLTYTVTGDVDTIKVDAKWLDNADVALNDWCGEGVIVTMPDGTKTVYQWGGAQVSWGWDADGDKKDDSVDGVKGKTWLGTAADNAASFEVPVAQGAVVEFITLSYDGAPGVDQFTLTISGDKAAAETPDAPAEETEEIVEDTADAADETVESEETAEIVSEPNWDEYDADAMAALNEEFALGVTDQIDLYALVGDEWENLAKVEGTFVWNTGNGGWCGGGGLGGGATLADGTSWVGGPEYGAANGNAAVEPDGTATQTIIEISAENPLATIATYNEDTGATEFGKLFVQNWWNGVETGAQVAAITAYDFDGNVIGEITYDVAVEAPEATPDTPAVDVEAPTEDGKGGSPDTGVAGVAAAAGLVALAGAAVVASRKRK